MAPKQLEDVPAFPVSEPLTAQSRLDMPWQCGYGVSISQGVTQLVKGQAFPVLYALRQI